MPGKLLFAVGRIPNPHARRRDHCRSSASLRSPTHVNNNSDDSASRVDRNPDVTAEFVRYTAGGYIHAN